MLAELPYRGITRAIGATHIPFLPLHIADMERRAGNLPVLVLPNIGAMSDGECAIVRRFVERGGTLIATGVTSLYDENGEARADFGLAPVFGAHILGGVPGRMFFVTPTTASFTGAPALAQQIWPRHTLRTRAIFRTALAATYCRLLPELAATTQGPHNSEEPHSSGSRNEVLAGFEETDTSFRLAGY